MLQINLLKLLRNYIYENFSNALLECSLFFFDCLVDSVFLWIGQNLLRQGTKSQPKPQLILEIHLFGILEI